MDHKECVCVCACVCVCVCVYVCLIECICCMLAAVALFVSFLVNLFVMAVFAKAFSNMDFASLERAVSTGCFIVVFFHFEPNEGEDVWYYTSILMLNDTSLLSLCLSACLFGTLSSLPLCLSLCVCLSLREILESG